MVSEGGANTWHEAPFVRSQRTDFQSLCWVDSVLRRNICKDSFPFSFLETGVFFLASTCLDGISTFLRNVMRQFV